MFSLYPGGFCAPGAEALSAGKVWLFTVSPSPILQKFGGVLQAVAEPPRQKLLVFFG